MLVADAADGLAFEADLFAAQGSQIGFWTAGVPSLVCPRAYRTRNGFEAATVSSAAHGRPVHLRPSGGGTVPQGPGIDNLVLAFDAPKGFTIEDGYGLLVHIIKTGLRDRSVLETGSTPGSFCDGAWNLSAEGKKIVGTAQRWRPVRGGLPRVLAHAMILTKDDIRPAVNAVAAFHKDLGLSEIETDAHTSVEATFGMSELPIEALRSAAQNALAALSEPKTD